MHKRLSFIVLLVLSTGCGGNSSTQAPNSGTPRVQVQIGGPGTSEPSGLPFTIKAVYDKQQLTKVSPFHENGGDWTCFDCEAGTDKKALFTVGVMAKNSGAGAPFAWGRAVLMVSDREAGARFLELFAKTFPGTMPMVVQQHFVPTPFVMNTAILGDSLDREALGGFSGQGGEWTATKWFLEGDSRSGEVFFNYNLSQRKGEFSEKDAEYGDDLLAILASALRDGPRPERTPENDPNLSLVGPSIGPSRKLLERITPHCSFSSDARFVVYQDGSTLRALPIDEPNGQPFEIAQFDHSPWEVHVVNADLDLVVQEGVAETPGVKSSGDPMRIWWVDGKTKTKALLQGPEKDLDLAEAPVSPDGRYVAIQQWRKKPGSRERTKELRILDRESGKAKVCELQGKDLSLVRWESTESGPRAIAMTNRWRLDKNVASELYLADPSTGKLERQDKADARFELDHRLSPDGKHRVQVGKDELIVTGVADGTQRVFVLHEDDRQFVGEECVEWVSPRYLKFNGTRLALIDVTTMKMCFPATADGMKFSSHSYMFSSDFRWVLFQGEGTDGEGLFLASVEMPGEL